MFVAIEIHGLSILPVLDENNSLKDSSMPRLVSAIEGLGVGKSDVGVYIPKEVHSEDAPIFVTVYISEENKPATNHVLLELERVVVEELTKYCYGRSIRCCTLISPLVHPDRAFPSTSRRHRR